MGVTSAEELARVTVAVGLAQNMAALRVLSTEGVQRGHMELHGRNIIAEVRLIGKIGERVLQRMIEEQDVRYDRAVELAKEFGQ